MKGQNRKLTLSDIQFQPQVCQA